MYRFRYILHNAFCYKNLLQSSVYKVGNEATAILAPWSHKLIPSGLQLQRKVTSESKAPANLKSKKTREIIKVTLIAQNQAMSVTTLDDAKKLAKRRDLRLVQVNELDTKTGRAVYKLVTAGELLTHELNDAKTADSAQDKGAQQIKAPKSLTIGIRITDHDLASRLKNIAKWLEKRHEVRILIQGSSEHENTKHIIKAIEDAIKEPQTIGKIAQKRCKGTNVKFNILPVTVSTPTPMPS